MDKTGFGKYLVTVLAKMGKQAAALTLAPSILVLVIWLFFGWGVQTATIAVSVQDTGFDMPGGMGHISIPDQLISGLDKKVFQVIKVNSAAEAYKLVEQGKASIALSFPDGLTQDMMIKLDDPSYNMNAKIGISVDKANPIVSLMTAGKLASVLAKNAQGFDLGKLPLPVDLSELQKGGVPNIGAFVMPGLFILLIFIISVIATSALTMKLKSENPELKTGKANAAFVTVYTVIYALQAFLLFLTGILVFQVHIPGNLALAGLPILLMVFCGAAFGTMYATVMKKANMAGAGLFAILPIFLCGVLFPLEMVPAWLRWISFILPPFYTVKSFRGFTLYNNGFTSEWMFLAALLLLGTVFLAVSILAAGKDKKEA